MGALQPQSGPDDCPPNADWIGPPPVPEPASNDTVGVALWMAGGLAGLFVARLVGFGKRKRRRAKCAKPARKPPKPTPEEALPMLADAIVGNSKSAIARIFGPPPSAVVRRPADALSPTAPADTWYYPLPRHNRLAMAITFNDDHARRVEFLRAPGL